MEKIKQYLQNINVNREYFSLSFFATGIILSIVFSLLFISASKTYTSSITILVNAKSEVAAQQEKQIVGNISEFPKTLAFYNRLLKYNPDVKDIAVNKSRKERRRAWNNMLSVKKIGKNSSLIKISITAKQKNDADQLAQKTVRTLFDFTGFYYNIKTDVDLRIVDGPISCSNTILRYWMSLAGIIVGFLIAFVLQYVLLKRKGLLADMYKASLKTPLFNLRKEYQENSEQDNLKSLEDLYMSDVSMEIPTFSRGNYENTITPKIQEMKKLTKIIEEDKYPNFSEVPKQTQAKAAAPDNLPIADDSFLNQSHLNIEHQIIEQQPKTEEIKETLKNQIHQEPNAEQIKQRLNKLLRGEF